MSMPDRYFRSIHLLLPSEKLISKSFLQEKTKTKKDFLVPLFQHATLLQQSQDNAKGETSSVTHNLNHLSV